MLSQLTEGGSPLPGRHAQANLTIADRLEQLEMDMTAVHDAVGQLAAKLDQVEQLVAQQSASHIAVIQAQVDRVDQLITQLRGDQPDGQAPESADVWSDVTPTEHQHSGLMG